MARIRRLRTGWAVLLAALLLLPWSQQAGASEHENAPAMTAEGELRILHIDHFERGRSETAYLLRDLASGETFVLKFERSAPRLLRTGDRVSVRGRAVGRNLWVTDIVAGLDQEGTGEPTETQPAAAAAQRRALLLVLNMPRDPGYYGPATVDSATGKMFLDGFSVDSLYVETSFGQFGFPGPGVGDVFGPLDIPTFAGCPWPNALYWIANAADAAAADAGIDISAYDNKFYLIPPKSISDCSWLAVGEVGFYGGTGVYRAWSTRNDTVAYAHELGHNLGWHHAATDPDNNGAMNVEYGDTSDIMGYCCSERKFNGAHVDQIGWFDASPADIVTVVGSGTYQIAPLGGGNGFGHPRIIKIDKPDTSEVYYLSYRQANGLDVGISSTYTRGVNIHHARETGIWSYFIDALVDGESFVDAVNGVTVTQTGKNGDYVTVDVSFDSCVRQAPSIALGPSTQLVSDTGGAAPTYNVTLTNNDSQGCDDGNYGLSPDLGLLSGTVAPTGGTVAPGQELPGTLTVDVVGAADGAYTLWLTATDSDGFHSDVSASANLQIDTTPPLAPTGLTTAKKKVKGRLAVRVTWDAGVDAGSGVAAYRLYRDGAPIADTADVSYIDRTVANGVTYSYTLSAVDNAGNWSGLCSPAAYPPDGGGDGSGDGGTKPSKGWGKGGKPK